jgi:hypothetical protein
MVDAQEDDVVILTDTVIDRTEAVGQAVHHQRADDGAAEVDQREDRRLLAVEVRAEGGRLAFAVGQVEHERQGLPQPLGHVDALDLVDLVGVTLELPERRRRQHAHKPGCQQPGRRDAERTVERVTHAGGDPPSRSDRGCEQSRARPG